MTAVISYIKRLVNSGHTECDSSVLMVSSLRWAQARESRQRSVGVGVEVEPANAKENKIYKYCGFTLLRGGGEAALLRTLERASPSTPGSLRNAGTLALSLAVQAATALRFTLVGGASLARVDR
jgi:hypothetical protein